MNPKSGDAGNAIDPVEAEKANDADEADPGKVEEAKTAQQQQQSKGGGSGGGKYAPKKEPHKPPAEDEENTTQTSWIEFELLDEADKPVPGEVYEVTLPDGTVEKGSLDGKGFCRIDGIEPGTCQITFPNLDKDAWALK